MKLKTPSPIPPFFLLLTIFMFLFSICPVYGAEPIDLYNFPSKLAEALNIPVFAGQILTSTIFMFMWLLPLNILKKGKLDLLTNLIISLLLLGFCVAVGWLPYWIMLIVCLIVASLWSDKIKKLVGR